MNNILRIVRALWGIGNFWFRLAIIIVASWPFLITFTAFIGWPTLTAIVTLLPLIAVVIGFIALIDPVVIAMIGAVWPAFLKATALIVGTELTIGVYFSAVPVTNDQALIPLVLLLLLAIIFLTLGRGMGIIIVILYLLFVGLTAVFILGGRDKAKEKAEEWIRQEAHPTSPQSAAVPPATQRLPELKPVGPPMWPWKASETVSLNEGDTVETKLWVGPGMNIDANANKKFRVIEQQTGAYYSGLAGISHWRFKAGSQPGPIKIVGLANNTTIEWQRVD